MSPGVLRAVALVAAVAGAVGSEAFMLRAGRNTPRLLLIAFVFWVLIPYAAFAWAHVVSKPWPALPRATLYWAMLLVAPASLATYSGLVPKPAGSANAVFFVLVPPVSGLFMGIAVGVAALISRRRLPRGP